MFTKIAFHCVKNFFLVSVPVVHGAIKCNSFLKELDCTFDDNLMGLTQCNARKT